MTMNKRRAVRKGTVAKNVTLVIRSGGSQIIRTSSNSTMPGIADVGNLSSRSVSFTCSSKSLSTILTPEVVRRPEASAIHGVPDHGDVLIDWNEGFAGGLNLLPIYPRTGRRISCLICLVFVAQRLHEAFVNHYAFIVHYP